MDFKKFVSAYVRSADVKEPVELTISSVELEEVGQGEDRTSKPVLYAEEIDQGIVLGSKAVCEFFLNTFGEETSEWIGQKVVLYKDPNVLFKGKRVGGIRFRLPE